MEGYRNFVVAEEFLKESRNYQLAFQTGYLVKTYYSPLRTAHLQGYTYCHYGTGTAQVEQCATKLGLPNNCNKINPVWR